MKIKSIELIGYVRFSLNQVHRLSIVFNEKIQLILGTNGSGKSSLLKELSPLPAERSDYEKGGSKTIVIEYKNSIYCLISSFETNPRHSFLKDTIELNTGGTATVQKELVKKEFNLTPDLHEVYIGQKSFHRMTVAQRRQWFTILSHTDYTYALNTFNKLKDKYRDLLGALKLNQSRLIQESKKLLNPEQEMYSRQYIEYLKGLVGFLHGLEPEYYTSVPVSTTDITTTFNQISSQVKDVVSLFKAQYNHSNVLESNSIDVLKIDYQSNIKTLDKYIEDTSVQLKNKEAIMKTLLETNNNSVEDIASKIIGIDLNICNLKNNNSLGLVFENSVLALNALETVYDSIMNIFKEVTIPTDIAFTRDNYKAIKEKLDLINSEIKQLEDSQLFLMNKVKELDHTKVHNSTECPRCKHVWVRGYSDEEYLSIKDKLSKIIVAITNKKILAKSNTETLEAINIYFQLYAQYLKINTSWPVLNSLWVYLSDNSIFNTNPSSVITILEKTRHTLLNLSKIEILVKNKVELEVLLQNIENDKNKNIDERKTEIESLHEKIYILSQEKRHTAKKFQDLIQYEELLADIANKSKELNKTIFVSETQTDIWLKKQFRIYLSKLIEVVYVEINKEETITLQIDRQRIITESIEIQNIKYVEDIKALKILMTELSPTEGLIAKGMQSFINIFLKEINSILKKIWLYPLELIITDVLDEDSSALDYKFSLRVNGNSVIPDINEASTAMKEVIDLSFKIVCMKYLNMTDYPIFLDEFGASMDSAHRSTAINTVKDLVTNSNFSQIFIISHYESSYGSFKNSQVNVLCGNNIVIPKDMQYNKNLTIE